MTRTLLGLFPVIVVLLLCAVLAWWMAQAPTMTREVTAATPDERPDRNQTLSPEHPLALVQELRHIDAAWSLAALETLSVGLSDFDSVAGFLPRVREIRRTLRGSELADEKAPIAIRIAFNRFLSLSEAKEEAIEQLKSNHAAMRNSQRYLPLAFDAAMESGRKIASPDVVARIREINQRLSDFLAIPDQEEKAELRLEIDWIEQEALAYPPRLANLLGNYANHARVLLERAIPMSDILARVADRGTAEIGNELLSAYRQWLMERAEVQHIAQLEEHQARQEELAKADALAVAELQHWRQITQLLVLLLGTGAILVGLLYWWGRRTTHSRLTAALSERAGMQIDESQKANLAFLSRMGASMAHEINTPLGYLSSNIDMLATSYRHLDELLNELARLEVDLKSSALALEDEQAPLHQQIYRLSNALHSAKESAMLEEIPDIVRDLNTGIEQIQYVVSDLRQLGGTDTTREREWFDLNEAIRKVIKMTSPQMSENIHVLPQFGELPKLHGSEGQMTQVFTNLVDNGAQAIEATGRSDGQIEITTSVRGSRVYAIVSDNGNGISEADQKRIFEPFFTTKSPGKGTGLGLAIVNNIIIQHGGSIAVHSSGDGTQFEIILPIEAQPLSEPTT